jgi:transposase
MSKRGKNDRNEVDENLVGQRTALINTVRGHAAEFGIVVGRRAGKIRPLLSALPSEAREMFLLLGRRQTERRSKVNEVSQRLVTIPGVGPVTALTLGVEINPTMFESGCCRLAGLGGIVPATPPGSHLGLSPVSIWN